MSDTYLDYVEHILDAMEKAEILITNVRLEQFKNDFRINFAVVRALEIIGEATKRLPMTLRDQYPQIPWKGMAGMRDRIVHGYDNIDLDIVWDVVKQDIPHIRPYLQQILDEHNTPNTKSNE